MKVTAITALIWLALAATAAGQSKSSGNADSPGVSKASLAEVRAVVHELEGHTEKLRELLSQHSSLVDERPESEGASPEAKKAHDKQLAKWSSALERLLVRIADAHTTVVETVQRLDKSITGELPTGLAKDVAKVRNEADPERATAEQVLSKKKPAATRKAK